MMARGARAYPCFSRSHKILTSPNSVPVFLSLARSMTNSAMVLSDTPRWFSSSGGEEGGGLVCRLSLSPRPAPPRVCNERCCSSVSGPTVKERSLCALPPPPIASRQPACGATPPPPARTARDFGHQGQVLQLAQLLHGGLELSGRACSERSNKRSRQRDAANAGGSRPRARPRWEQVCVGVVLTRVRVFSPARVAGCAPSEMKRRSAEEKRRFTLPSSVCCRPPRARGAWRPA